MDVEKWGFGPIFYGQIQLIEWFSEHQALMLSVSSFVI